MGEKQPEELIAYVRKRLQNFYPHAVRRVEIPKPDGRMRPLGIPTMEDRIIQQCIKQVLEPICEAKFYKHSYGFRPNRSAHHAIARAMFLVNISKYRYVVDVDIKGESYRLKERKEFMRQKQQIVNTLFEQGNA